jgi:hypothetical protein
VAGLFSALGNGFSGWKSAMTAHNAVIANGQVRAGSTVGIIGFVITDRWPPL